MIKRPSHDQYRPSAGIVVFNPEGLVLMGQRKVASGPYIWQFPQGGIDKGEKPLDGAVRELFEETGIKNTDIELLDVTPGWLYYDFPAGFQGRKAARGWLGQRQKWYAFRFHGKDKNINLNAHGPVEFTNWRWDELARAPKLAVPFKQPVYEVVCSAFAKYAHPVGPAQKKPKKNDRSDLSCR